jgi:hypothetical protein
MLGGEPQRNWLRGQVMGLNRLAREKLRLFLKLW